MARLRNLAFLFGLVSVTPCLAANSQTKVSFNACSSGWSYGIAADMIPAIDQQFDARPGQSGALDVVAKAGVQAPTLTGNQIGADWSLTLTLPASERAALVALLPAHRLMSIEVDFRSTTGGLTLVNFDIHDTNAINPGC